MALVTLPPITITQGVEYYERFTFAYDEAGDEPIDLTGWTGTYTLSKRPFEKPFFTAELVLGGATGTVDITITAEDTATFGTLPRVGGSPNAVQQYELIAPDPVLNQIWQGPATIAGRFKA
jgi:hypothetical protein